MLVVHCNSYGQQAEIDKALKQGKQGKDFFIIFPNTLLEDKYNKWKNSNKKIRILHEKFIERAVYGTDIKRFVSEIHFITEEEALTIEKANIFKNAIKIKDKFAAYQKYPDYPIENITSMSIDNIYGDFIIPCGFWNLFSCFDYDLMEQFFKTFPEYKTNQELIQMVWNGTRIEPKRFVALFGESAKEFTKQQTLKSNLLRITLSEFIDFYGDLESAKQYVYYNTDNNNYMSAEDVITYIQVFKEYDKAYEYVVKQMQKYKNNLYELGFWGFGLDGTHKWINRITPFLKGHVDVSYIEKTLIQAKREYEEESARRNSEYYAKMCRQCEIDFDNSNNKLPESYHPDDFIEHLLFSYDKPGVWYMKNGDKYEFYQNSDLTWKISTGIFSSKTFENPHDMLIYFIEECIKRYCK